MDKQQQYNKQNNEWNKVEFGNSTLLFAPGNEPESVFAPQQIIKVYGNCTLIISFENVCPLRITWKWKSYIIFLLQSSFQKLFVVCKLKLMSLQKVN